MNAIAPQQDGPTPLAASRHRDAAKHKRGRRRSDEGVPGFRGLTDHLATMTLNLVVSPQAPNATITLAYTVPERGARIARRHPHHKSGASEPRREASEAGRQQRF